MVKNTLFLFVAVALFFVSACSDDDGPSVVDVDSPQVTISDDGNVDGTILLPGDTIRISVQGQAGTNPMEHVRFLENDERIVNFTTRLFVNDSLSPSTQLTIDPESSIAQSFDMDVIILAPELGGDYLLEVEIADADENASRASLNYFVKDVVEISGVLENAAKTDSTGGLDLSTGTGAGSSDINADIVDFGNNPDGSWQQRIATLDTNIVRDERPFQLVFFEGGLDFENILTKAQVRERFEEGEIVEDSGREVEEGEVYAVRRVDDYFLFRVSEVNNSPGDNNDSYTFLIKAGQ
jgi:hypothetical protein